MADPVLEDIAVDLLAAINAITTGNGFNYSLTGIRPRKDDFVDTAPDDLTVLVIQGDDFIDEDGPVGVHEFVQTFLLAAIVLDTDDSTAAMDTKRNKVKADIQKKILADHQRDSNAIDTTLVGSIMFNEGRGFAGVAVQCEVRYRTDYGDPFTKG